MSEALRLGDRPIVIRGDGVGVSRLIWTAAASSSGVVVTQGKQQHVNTDFTHVIGLSLWTRQLRKATALTIDLTGAPRRATLVYIKRFISFGCIFSAADEVGLSKT